MATTIKNFVRAIRWYDGVVAAVLFVAWISIGPRAEVAQGYPLHYTFIHAYGMQIMLVLAGVVYVNVRLSPTRSERASSLPAAGDPTPGDPASGKTREPETGGKS